MLAENVVPYAWFVARTSCKNAAGKTLPTPVHQGEGLKAKKEMCSLKVLTVKFLKFMVPFKIWQSIWESIDF